mgnify:CR=1 FL=1
MANEGKRRDLSNFVDTINISLDKGYYRAEVKGKRDRGEDEFIHNFGGNHFEDIVTRLFDYHFKCFMLMEREDGRRDAAEYSGAGSDRGEWHPYWMIKWELKTKEEFTNSQNKILDGIVTMHNQYVSAYEGVERLEDALSQTLKC